MSSCDAWAAVPALPPAAAQSQLAGDFDLGNPWSDDSVPLPAIALAATAAAQAANTDDFGFDVTDLDGIDVDTLVRAASVQQPVVQRHQPPLCGTDHDGAAGAEQQLPAETLRSFTNIVTGILEDGAVNAAQLVSSVRNGTRFDDEPTVWRLIHSLQEVGVISCRVNLTTGDLDTEYYLPDESAAAHAGSSHV